MPGLSRVWGVVRRHPVIAWSAVGAMTCAALLVLVPITLIVLHVDGDRANLPDPGPFERFEFLAIGHVYDASGAPLIQLAREHRSITADEDIPPVVRDAIVATEDKDFFTHNGVDYSTIPRVLRRVRMATLLARMAGRGPSADADAPAIFDGPALAPVFAAAPKPQLEERKWLFANGTATR